ncbi:MAG: SURF1 family protein [Methylohalobius sp.]
MFLFLAQWQLHRAQEKEALRRLNVRRLQAPVQVLRGDERLAEGLRYRSVIVTGVWDGDHQFLLDNRIWHGRVGYEVLTPLEIEGTSKLVLVNRGWVAATGDRKRLPEVSLPRKQATIRGMVDRFPEPGLYLRGMEIPTDGWPAVVQQLNAEVIGQRLGRPILDFQIKMAPDIAGGYVREWQLDFIDPRRNLGYALQWASFALIVSGLWVWHGLKRARELRAKKVEHG